MNTTPVTFSLVNWDAHRQIKEVKDDAGNTIELQPVQGSEVVHMTLALPTGQTLKVRLDDAADFDKVIPLMPGGASP